MGGAIRRLWFLAVSFLLLSLAGWISPAAMAQQGTATINGVVKDPTGAAIPNARVELTNVGTSVVRSTSTNSAPSVSRAGPMRYARIKDGYRLATSAFTIPQ